MKIVHMYKFFLTCAVFLTICTVGMTSCEDKPPAKELSLVELVCQPKSGGHFRGVSLGTNPDAVISAEIINPTSATDTVIEYRNNIEWNGEEMELVIYYAFDSFGLFEIQADLFTETKDGTRDAFEEFDAYFDESYGEPNCTGMMCRWTTFGTSNNLVEVTLSSESMDDSHPFLSINYLEPLSDEI